MTNDTTTELLSVADAIRRLGLDRVARDPRRAVLAMVRRGEIRGVKVGRWVMIDAASLEAYVGARTQ